MLLNLKPERSWKAWLLRFLLGPAMTIDGVFATVSGGTFAPRLSLKVARELSVERMLNMKEL